MKFDDYDYHANEAVEAGYPPENGFSHIGLYLAWLIRNDLHDPTFFPPEHVAAVRAGEMTGSDMSDHLDHKLMSDGMTAEGAAFTSANYDRYLAAYGAEFSLEPDYSIEDNAASYARIAPALDAAYRDWLDAGRPSPVITIDSIVPPSMAQEVAAAMSAWMTPERTEALVAMVESGSYLEPGIDDVPQFHSAPELERMLAERLGLEPNEVQSTPANVYGSSLLKRALKRLGVPGRDASVVFALAGTGEHSAMVSIYGVPGIDGPRLASEFADVIHRPSRKPWTKHTIEGRAVQRIADAQFEVVYWATDGLVFHLGANRNSNVEALARRLLGS